MAKTGSKSGGIVKRGAGGRFMGSVKGSGQPLGKLRAGYGQNLASFRRQSADDVFHSLKVQSSLVGAGRALGHHPSKIIGEALRGRAAAKALKEKGSRVIQDKNGSMTIKHDRGGTPKRMGKAQYAKTYGEVSPGVSISGRQVGKKVSGLRSRGVVAKAGLNLSQAKEATRKWRERYSVSQPSRLGGELTKQYHRAQSPSNPASIRAEGVIQHRAIAHVLNENRAKKAKGKRG